MPRILAIIWGLYHNQFKYINLKNETLSIDILLHFIESALNSEYFGKTIDPHSLVFPKLFTPKNVVA